MTNRSKANKRRKARGLMPLGIVNDSGKALALEAVEYLAVRCATTQTGHALPLSRRLITAKNVAWTSGYIVNMGGGLWAATERGVKALAEARR